MISGHGSDAYKYKDIRIDFSSNIYRDVDHENLFCHLADRLDEVVNYPEPTPLSLESELGMLLGLKPEEVIVTNGATEAIYLIAQTFRSAKSAVMQPTFAEYADACRIHEHTVTNAFHTSALDFERQIYGANLIWICCPNNPTGTVFDKEELLELISRREDAIFVIDASYAPFTQCPLITPQEAAELPNVLMLHSMTKEFAIPGLRLGYLTGNETLLHQIRLQRMPWSVNQLAIDAGHYLLMHKDEYEIDLDSLLSETRRMADRLKSLGVVEVWPSDTHILLCKLRIGKASALKDYLATEHGILIRDASNFSSLDEGFFRIAVQTPEEDDELLNAIIEWISE